MTILAVLALLLAPAAPHASAVPVQSAVFPQAVAVRLGEASLEEYRQGDPANRVLLLRGSQSAKKL